MSTINKPLTKLQLEILKLYSFDVSDKQLLDIKRLLANYFADKATDEMDKLWEENNWTDDTMDGWLKDNQIEE